MSDTFKQWNSPNFKMAQLIIKLKELGLRQKMLRAKLQVKQAAGTCGTTSQQRADDINTAKNAAAAGQVESQ